MKEPVFLELDEMLGLDVVANARYGGADGVRNRGLLDSALAMPRAMFGGQFLHGSLPEMAAAYLFHLVKNHPFVDGNKRAGAVATLLFLSLNNLWLEASSTDLAELTLGVAEGRLTKSDAAVWIRDHAIPFGTSRTPSS